MTIPGPAFRGGVPAGARGLCPNYPGRSFRPEGIRRARPIRRDDPPGLRDHPILCSQCIQSVDALHTLCVVSWFVDGNMVAPIRETPMPPRMPYTRQIIADITDRIDSGEWPPGFKLPSITELAAEYRCSAAPVRVALTQLQGAGLVVGHQGVGNFVADV